MQRLLRSFVVSSPRLLSTPFTSTSTFSLFPSVLPRLQRCFISSYAPDTQDKVPYLSLNNMRVELSKSFEGIAVLRLDAKDSKVNTLSPEFSPEFKQVFEKLQNDPTVKGVVVISEKKDNFIAGADIKMLAACKTAAEAQALSADGQRMLDLVANSKKPIVAAINGSCLGGGLEVALACHYRVAAENPKTLLGLPEVQLGLLPGAGGTQRLPRLVGLQSSLDMMLTGKNIRPKQAKRMGLVDQVADPNALEFAALQAASNLVNGSLKPKRELNFINKTILSLSPIRNLVFSQAQKMVDAKTGGHYPAPGAILKVAQTGLDQGMTSGLAKEAEEFGRLAKTKVSEALVNIYFATTALKKNRFGTPAHPTKNITVLGAGLMGAGITQVSLKNYNTFLYDRDQQALARGEKQIYDNLSQNVKKKQMTAFDRDLLLSNIVKLTDATPSLPKFLSKTDMIIEAVPEDLKLKHKVLGNLEKLVPDHCVIASNTSALPISEIAAGLKNPERVIGMHYFSPVEKMPLLEIITTDKTSKTAAAAAVEVGLKQGKVVIVVKDGPGFYTTRILAPMMAEAIILLQAGVEVRRLDKVLRKFGFPVGPVTLCDEVGIDVGKHVSHFLAKAFGERMSEGADPASLDKLIEKGFLGRKTKKGFFLYNEEKKVHPLLKLFKKKEGKPINNEALALLQPRGPADQATFEDKELQYRMVMRFVNESILCLQDGILANPYEGDIGAIFGLGFPPHLGGPFRYVDQTGAEDILAIMTGLEKKFGKRFKPAELLVQKARDKKKFHEVPIPQ